MVVVVAVCVLDHGMRSERGGVRRCVAELALIVMDVVSLVGVACVNSSFEYATSACVSEVS